MFEYSHEGIYFRCHEENNGDRELRVDDDVDFINSNYFSYAENDNNAYDPNRTDIIFDPIIKNTCFRIFDVIKKMYSERIVERYSSLLVARLFEKLAGIWRTLLEKNKDRVAIVFWRKVFEIVQEWKSQNPNVFIHTGTPYYFLAETYFLVGDYDSGFTYLHNAIQIDKQSWQWDSPGHIGAYSFAKMIDDPRAQMNYLTQNIRTELIKYLEKFNTEHDSLTISEFDNKFLKNEEKYDIIGYFFTATFFTIIHNQRNSQLETNENYFSKVRSLDMIFNLCIIIDKILKRRFFQETESVDIHQGISKLFEMNQWTDYGALYHNWKNQGKYDENHPEISIPLFLNKQENYGTQRLPNGSYVMLLAQYCRNLGAHTLNENSVFVENHDKIINDLMMALFFSVKSIEAD